MLLEPAQSPLDPSLYELMHQRRRRGERHAYPLLAGGKTERGMPYLDPPRPRTALSSLS